MLASKNSIKDFFQRNNLSLQEEKSLSDKEIDCLYLSAKDLGYGFTCFLHFAVISPEMNGVSTNFSSLEEVYELYAAFMVGFTNSKNN